VLIDRSTHRFFALSISASISALLLLGLTQTPLLAQSDDLHPEIYRISGKYFVKSGVDLGKVIVSPIHWKGKDRLLFSGAIATTGLVMAFLDRGIKEWVDDHQVTGSKDFSLFVTHLGEPLVLLGLSAVFYIGGEGFKDDNLRKTALLSLESFCINGIVVNGMRYLLSRSRPLSGDGPSSFHWFSLKNNRHSFPSGHTSTAFAVAAVIAGQSDSFLVGAVSYGLASLVAISRVYNNEHWASDVIAASIIGYFIGKKVLALNRPSDKNKPSLSIAPGLVGFSLSLRF
jgi:membrane-associated phospholipid phosphatase